MCMILFHCFCVFLRRTKTSFSEVQGVKSRKTQGTLLLTRSQPFDRLKLSFRLWFELGVNLFIALCRTFMKHYQLSVGTKYLLKCHSVIANDEETITWREPFFWV